MAVKEITPENIDSFTVQELDEWYYNKIGYRPHQDDELSKEELKTLILEYIVETKVKSVEIFVPVEKQQYDAVEVHPCKVIDHVMIENLSSCCIETCEPEEADFWSVYLHVAGEGVICVADCGTKKEADALAELLKVTANGWKGEA